MFLLCNAALLSAALIASIALAPVCVALHGHPGRASVVINGSRS